MWEKEEDLENAVEAIKEFEVQYGENQRITARELQFEEGFERRMPGRFTAKVLFGWDNEQFDQEYLKQLERNWKKWKNT